MSVNRINTAEDQPSNETSILPDGCQKLGTSVKRYVEENPTVATAITFGVGLAVGFVATSMISSATSKPELGNAHRLGRYVLDNLGQVLPEALTNRFGS